MPTRKERHLGSEQPLHRHLKGNPKRMRTEEDGDGRRIAESICLGSKKRADAAHTGTGMGSGSR